MVAAFLADEDNKVRPVLMDDLVLRFNMLRSEQLRLVFLDFSHNPEPDSSQAALALGARLLGSGLTTAVLAIQDQMPETVAETFSRTFYSHLLQRGLVDLAANEARAHVVAITPQAAIRVPVLLTGSRTNELFASQAMRRSLQPIKPDIMSFDQLEIKISETETDHYRIELHFENGREYHAKGAFTLDYAELLPYVGGVDDERLGRLLFQTIVSDQNMASAWNVVRGLSDRFRVRLDLAEAEKLFNVPWELLRDTSGAIPEVELASDFATPFSRQIRLTSFEKEPANAAPILERPVRMLVAVANPINLADYQLEPITLPPLQRYLEGLPKDFEVQISTLTEPCTLDRLSVELEQGYHLLHLECHSTHSRRQEDAILYLANKDNEVALVSGTDFVQCLSTSARLHLRLLVLVGSKTLSLGARLVATCIPTTISMQDLVSFDTARRFRHIFYRQLFQHGLLDLACNEARAALIAAQAHGHFNPVLCSRLPGNRLFARNHL